MKQLTTLLLLLSLLLSVLASCQGTVPTGSLPQTKETAPLTEEKTSEEKTMTPKEAKSILSAVIGTPSKAFREAADGSRQWTVSEDEAQAIETLWTHDQLNAYQDEDYVQNYVMTLHRYFQLVEQYVHNVKCSIVFEKQKAFREDNGAYYVNDGTVLYFYRSRGETEYSSPNGVIHFASYAFAGNTALEKVTLNAPLKDIHLGSHLFADCPSLKTVNVPCYEGASTPNGRNTGKFLFSDSFDYSSELSFAPDAPLIAAEQYQSCYERFVKSDRVRDENPNNFIVTDGALVAYTGIGGHVVIPEGVTEIREGAFRNCVSSVLSVTFPSTLKTLCHSSLQGLSIPFHYQLPEGLEKIEANAFGLGSSSLSFFVTGIPESCVVEEKAFPVASMETYGRNNQGLPELPSFEQVEARLEALPDYQRLTWLSQNAEDLAGMGIVTDVSTANGLVMQPSIRKLLNDPKYFHSARNDYFPRLEELLKQNRLSLLDTESFAFRDGMAIVKGEEPTLLYVSEDTLTTQKELVVPEGVVHLYEGSLAFRTHYGHGKEIAAEVIRLPQSVKTIGNGAFQNMPHLKEIDYSADGSIAGNCVFLDELPFTAELDSPRDPSLCKNLLVSSQLQDTHPEAYVIEDGVLVKYLGLGGNLVIPEGVKGIRKEAFYSALGSVLSIRFPESLEWVESGTFCANDARYALEGVQYSDSYDKALHRLEFPDSVKEIPAHLVDGYCFSELVVAKDCTVAEGAVPDYAKVVYRD